MSTNGTRLTRTQAWVLALTSAASLMVSLDTQVVATALPVIRVQLHASLAELEWTVNAYKLTFAVLLLTGAALAAAIGQASGTLNTLRQLGGVFGVAICAAVFAARGHYASPATFVAGFSPAMAACAGLALLGAAAGLVIPGRRQAPASAVPVQNHAPKIEIRR